MSVLSSMAIVLFCIGVGLITFANFSKRRGDDFLLPIVVGGALLTIVAAIFGVVELALWLFL